jgi:hypothetical protein
VTSADGPALSSKPDRSSSHPRFLRRLDLLARDAMRRLDVRVDDGLADGLDDQHQLAEATARHDRWHRR